MIEKWYNKGVSDFFSRHGPPRSEFSVDENTKIYNFFSSKAFTHTPGAGVVETGCFIEITAVKGYITKMTVTDGRGAYRMTRCEEIWKP